MMLAREIHIIQQAFTSMERVALFLLHKKESDLLGKDGFIGAKSKPVLEGSIQFKNVFMKYDSEDPSWILKDISFFISHGEKVGIVGATGSGKTSLVRLLSRLYEFQKGDIFIDGCSIKDYQRSFLRSQIGFVSQESVLFHGTLRENLIMDRNISDNEIKKACDNTGLFNLFMGKHMTLDSIIYEDGLNLSEGEQQILSITRVLLSSSGIFIFDEATAHMDLEFEENISNAIGQGMDGKTCLIITHRLETLKYCDRIFVFDKGRLFEEHSKEDFFKRARIALSESVK